MFGLDLTLDGEALVLPAGYRWLLVGETKHEGDMFADMEYMSWEPCLSWKRGEIVREGGLRYIRKIKQLDNVPLIKHQSS